MSLVTTRQLNRPVSTFLEHRGLRFLILDQPTSVNQKSYIEECKKHGVTHLICVCEMNYDTVPFEQAGIEVLNWEFDDGTAPPDEIVDKWISLLRDNRQRKTSRRHSVEVELSGKASSPRRYTCAEGVRPPQDVTVTSHQQPAPATIGIHCKAGLGRAPVLVAMALMEAGLSYDEAVELIRQQRHGAFNAKQIQFLKNYQPKQRIKSKGTCVIS